MKKLIIILFVFLLAGCQQDLGKGETIEKDVFLEEKKNEIFDSVQLDKDTRKYWFVDTNISVLAPTDEKVIGERILDKMPVNKRGLVKESEDFGYVRYTDGEKKVTRFYDNKTRVQGSDTGNFYHLGHATTTIEKWDKSMLSTTTPKTTVIEKISRLFGKEARATESTFYPDEDAESTSVDGYAHRKDTNGETFTTMVNGNGNGSKDDGNSASILIYADGVTNKYQQVERAITLFDTSSIPDDDDIDSAVISIYSTAQYNTFGAGYNSDEWNVYGANTSGNTSLTDSDYQGCGSTEFSSGISYTNTIDDDYNDFTLNASGLANISKTGVSKFSFRAEREVADDEPTWSNSAYWQMVLRMADYADANDPKLVVTHSEGGGEPEEEEEELIPEILFFN